MTHYPPPNNPAVCGVAMIFTRDLRTFVNKIHVARTDVPWDLGNMNILAGDIGNWMTTTYKGILPAAVTMHAVQVRKYNPLLPLAVDNYVGDPVGTRGGVAESGNVTLSLSLHTGLAGRAYRGRIYVPSLSENDVSILDNVTSGFASACAAAMAALNTAITAGGRSWVIFHRPLLVPKPLDNLYTTVTGSVIETTVDSQRRRLPGRGR